MTSLTGTLRPAVFPALAIAVSAVALTAGCQSSSSRSSAAATDVSTSVAAESAAASASVAPSGSMSATVSAGAVMPGSPDSSSPGVTGGAVVNPGGPMKPAGSAVYLAEGGDVRGTAVHEPSCAAGCPLSGDGTIQLTSMTWSTWTGTEAVGRGTEKIDDCTPDCATGKLYAVKVTVTFTKPVHVCSAGASRWYWTQASFTWPNGLPAVFKGANAPMNPFTYSGIASQSTSCG
jgi:hypothetical protein